MPRQRGSELAGDLAHPSRRHGCVADGQRAEQHLEHPVAGPEVRIELDPAEQGSEEPCDHLVGEASGL